MHLVYIGPHIDGVEIKLEGGGEIHAARNRETKVPSHLAHGLLEQPTNWKRPDPKLENRPKAELVALAEELGVELAKGSTRPQLAAAIVEAQGGGSDGS